MVHQYVLWKEGPKEVMEVLEPWEMVELEVELQDYSVAHFSSWCQISKGAFLAARIYSWLSGVLVIDLRKLTTRSTARQIISSSAPLITWNEITCARSSLASPSTAEFHIEGEPLNLDEDESGHFRPEAWRVAWETAQDVPAPSCEAKAAAQRLVNAEHLQQALGWLLLTQIGTLLGSFGPNMSVGVCLLSFAIFMVEAMLKYVRRWAHGRFFMDVPCSFVPIHQHQETAHDSLKVFGRYLISGTLLELFLYVPFIYYVVEYCRDFCMDNSICDSNPSNYVCQPGTNLVVYLLIICGVTTIVHWVTSLMTVLAFYFAMGRGILSLILDRALQKFNSDDEPTNWQKSIPGSCEHGGKKCTGTTRLSISRSPSDRVLCLTWWVHMARHRHLSAMVASAQPQICGLPGHWFESVKQLKRIVDECLKTGVGEQMMNSDGPLWVSQEMALRALVSLAKQDRAGKILENRGFELLVQVVREGKGSTSRGLAAAAIAVLATQHDKIQKAGVDLSVAVTPLRRLLKYKEHEVKEVGLGALLNTALTDDVEQYKNVLAQFHSPDGLVGRGNFMIALMDLAHSGPTTSCQELAIGLLARLAADSSPARAALIEGSDSVKHGGIELLIELLLYGQTTEIKASAAGALSELAFKEGRTIGRGPFGESCIEALIKQLRGESRIAHASTRALCNLAVKCDENKRRIVSYGGIECFMELLMDGNGAVPEKDYRPWIHGRERSAAGNFQSVLPQEVMAEAARALWMLALNNPQNQKRIADAGGIPRLVELFWNETQRVHMQAVAALSALAWKNKKNQELIRQEGSRIFSRIVQLLTDMEGRQGTVSERNRAEISMEGKVLEKVAGAISSFVDGYKSNREDLRNAGAVERLQTLAENSAIYNNEKVSWRVRKAIDSLTGNTER